MPKIGRPEKLYGDQSARVIWNFDSTDVLKSLNSSAGGYFQKAGRGYFNGTDAVVKREFTDDYFTSFVTGYILINHLATIPMDSINLCHYPTE